MPARLVLQCLLHGPFAGRTCITTVGNPPAIYIHWKGSRLRRSSSRPTVKQDSQATADTKPLTKSQQQVPAELLKARQLKAAGLSVSGAVLSLGLAAAWVQGVALPDIGAWSSLVAALLVPVGAAVLLLAVTADKAQIEVHKGRLYIQWGSPSTGLPLADDSVEVCPTGDGRGNGAFAAKHIPAGAYLGDYEGELLGEAAYWARYPSGVSDYSIRIDQEWSIDGQQRASDTATFSPCHMNHSSSRHNVVRSTSRRHQRVSFFTAIDIQWLQVGEELLLDYGSTYWKTREDQMLD